MPAPFIALTPEAFLAHIAGFAWRRRVWRVDLHHTFYPAHGDYCGEATIAAMAAYHTGTRGFADIAQHVSIAPDGLIWTGRDFNARPASVGRGFNAGAFMIEMIGNFDHGCDRLEGAQLAATLAVIAGVQQLFRLPPAALLFHREAPITTKTCPGETLSKPWVIAALTAQPALVAPLAEVALAGLSRMPDRYPDDPGYGRIAAD